MSDTLRDRMGRCITTLRVSVIDRCNLRCVYCIPVGGVPLSPRTAVLAHGHAGGTELSRKPAPKAAPPAPASEPLRGVLRFEEIAEVVAAAADLGVTRVKLTGGEPLLRRDIQRLVAMLAAIDGIDDLSLTTNGTLLSGLARPLRAAGLHRVTVSLDTLRPDRFRRITGGTASRGPGSGFRVAGSVVVPSLDGWMLDVGCSCLPPKAVSPAPASEPLQGVLAGIEAARRAGLAPIKVNVVALRGVNDDEFLDFARLTLDRPIEVRFIELMRIGHRARADAAWFLPMAEVRDRLRALGRLLPVRSSEREGPAVRFRFAGARGTVGFIAPITEPFCHRCNRLRLTSHGVLRACLLAGGEVGLKEALRPRPDRAALRAALREAARLKPARHAGAGTTPMSLIGG